MQNLHLLPTERFRHEYAKPTKCDRLTVCCIGNEVLIKAKNGSFSGLVLAADAEGITCASYIAVASGAFSRTAIVLNIWLSIRHVSIPTMVR